MSTVLSVDALAAMGSQVGVLSTGDYALVVPFRIRGTAVECRVPTWSGVGDLPERLQAVCLVVMAPGGGGLSWLFLRGPARLVEAPDWDGLQIPPGERSAAADLYQVVRIQPRRIEQIDEGRGWGWRETTDRIERRT